MRRWIFAALVLANLGLLMWGWFYLEAERPAVPEAQPPIHPEKMRLLKEAASNRPGARVKPPAPINAESNSNSVPPPVSVEKIETSPVCYRLGPLPDTTQAQRIEQALSGIPLSFTRREETTHTVTGFRVYLPPFPSKEDAERKRRELTRLGFKDHALLQEEGFHNAISLGQFSVEANAQNRLKQLVQKGVQQAKVQPLEQTRAVYWIELAPTDPTPDLRARFKAMLDGVSGAEVQQKPCPVPPPTSEPTPPG